MGHFYIRFFQSGKETDWTSFTPEDMDFILETLFDMCGPTYHTEGYYDTYERDDQLCLVYMLYGRPTPLPKELTTKTIEFGWGTSRKELAVLGDVLPVHDDTSVQVTYA